MNAYVLTLPLCREVYISDYLAIVLDALVAGILLSASFYNVHTGHIHQSQWQSTHWSSLGHRDFRASEVLHDETAMRLC